MEGTEKIRREADERVQKLIEKVGMEAEEAARARAEARLRAESDQIRIEAQKRSDRAREAAEEQIRVAADRARRDAIASASRGAPEWARPETRQKTAPQPNGAPAEGNGSGKVVAAHPGRSHYRTF
jgi:hypothetical protein